MTKKKRQKVYEKTGGHCGYCGMKIDIEDMQVDHMHPKRRSIDYEYDGGWSFEKKRSIDDMDNLMPSCRTCNHYKRASGVEGFRQKMLTMLGRLNKIDTVRRCAFGRIIKNR